jgi:hypothetical protein
MNLSPMFFGSERVSPFGLVQDGQYQGEVYSSPVPTKFPGWVSVILASNGDRRDIPARFLEKAEL